MHPKGMPTLKKKYIWFTEQPNLHEHDVVMEMDDSLPRGAWRLLRVNKVLPGDDGMIQKVEVINSARKTHLRPVYRLIPIVLE